MLASTAYLPYSQPELDELLLVMVNTAFDTAVSEPFQPEGVTGLGAGLVDMRCTGGLSLRRTIDVLGKALLTEPELRRMDGKQEERAVQILGVLAADYLEQARQFVFTQQEDIKEALLRAGNDVRQRLRTAEARFEAMFAASPSGVAVVDLSGNFLRTNESLHVMLDRAPAELSRSTLYDVVDPDEVPFLRAACKDLADGWMDRLHQQRRLVRGDGEAVRAALTLSLLRDSKSQPSQLLVTVHDETEVSLLQGQLSHQSLHDVLTGLPNRQFLSTRLEALLNQADRGTGTTLYQLDLDAFSVITDGLGRPAGEQVLCTVADRLREVFLSERAMIARIGRDEFAVLVENTAATPGVVATIERINEELAEPVYLPGGQGVTPSATIGVVHRPLGSMSMDDVFQAADLTLRRARRKGTSWELHDVVLDAADQERAGMAASLPGAWETGEVQVGFDRQVELATGRPHGVQAALRWDRPGHGVVDHRQCVELAEQTGMMLPLGSWLLRSACEQGAGLDAAVEISLPTCLANDEELVARVLGELVQSGLPAARLRVGLPAGALGGAAADNVGFLADNGIDVIVEEFGLGAHDLVYLEDLKLRSVRIARWLVARQARPEGPGPVVQRSLTQLVDLAHESGVTVAVDGIESEEQADWWRELGCDVGAGPYFD